VLGREEYLIIPAVSFIVYRLSFIVHVHPSSFVVRRPSFILHSWFIAIDVRFKLAASCDIKRKAWSCLYKNVTSCHDIQRWGGSLSADSEWRLAPYKGSNNPAIGARFIPRLARSLRLIDELGSSSSKWHILADYWNCIMDKKKKKKKTRDNQAGGKRGIRGLPSQALFI